MTALRFTGELTMIGPACAARRRRLPLLKLEVTEAPKGDVLMGRNGRPRQACTLPGFGAGVRPKNHGPGVGNTVHSAYFRDRLHQLALVAKVPRRVAPHQLRHAHAVELAREGVPIHLISRQLGHSSLATTQTYLSGISAADVIDAISIRQWPGGAR